MASKFKVTFVFEANQRGWTESYIYNSSGDDHTPIEGPATRLADARIGICGQGARIKAIRISKEGVGPDALLRYTDIKPPVVNIPGPDGGAVSFGPRAQPNVALLCRCSDVTESKRKFIFLRGIPDGVEVNGGVFTADKIYTQFFQRFIKQLTEAPWGWSGVSTKVGPVDLTSYTSTVTGIVTFTFAANLFAAPLFDKRVTVRLKGVNGKSAANGPHVVKVLDATQCRTVKPLGLVAYQFGGQGSYTTNDFQKIDLVAAQKIVTRKAGAPLLESRGRARVRARA